MDSGLVKMTCLLVKETLFEMTQHEKTLLQKGRNSARLLGNHLLD